MTRIKKLGLVLLIILYAGAGINHFLHPLTYLALIPPYLPLPGVINSISGAAEIIAALLLLSPVSRKAGAILIVTLLILFIPTHIYMMQQGWCIRSGYCFPVWATWLRLFPLQFILMYWAWWQRK